MVLVGLAVAGLCVVAAVAGIDVLVKHGGRGNAIGSIVVGATIAVLCAGGTYVGYAFVRAGIRIGRLQHPEERHVVRQSAIWIVLIATLGATLPLPIFEKVLFGIVLDIVGLAALAEDLEPTRTERTPRAVRKPGPQNRYSLRVFRRRRP